MILIDESINKYEQYASYIPDSSKVNKKYFTLIDLQSWDLWMRRGGSFTGRYHWEGRSSG